MQCEKYVQETCPALASTNITSTRRPTPQSPRSPAQNAAQALRKRPSAKRQVPDRPKPVHLFAACAMGDPDLVEGWLVSRQGRRALPAGRSTTVGSIMPPQADAEPHEGLRRCAMWSRGAMSWARRTSEGSSAVDATRADPALDDGHPDVRFPPLCAAVANGSSISLVTVTCGLRSRCRTSDGRQACMC